MLETKLFGAPPTLVALCPPELGEDDNTEAHG